MLLGLLFAALVLSAGYALPRVMGRSKGAVALGVLAPAGVAMLTCLTTWSTLVGAPPPTAGVLVAGMALAGLALVIVDRRSLLDAVAHAVGEYRTAAVVLGLALVVPVVVAGVAFAGLRAPLSTHDGAYHSETIEALRTGGPWMEWYPPGFASLFAAVLYLTPWQEPAQGTAELDLGLTLLTPLVMFGLACALWRNLLMASLSALAIALNFQLPYLAHFWSGWPLQVSVFMMLGLIAIAYQYLEQPTWRWAALAGLLVGAIMLVHATELYTMVIILPLIAAAHWRRIAWGALVRHLALAAGVAVLCAAPYLGRAFAWVASGAAVNVGNANAERLLNGGIGSLDLVVDSQFNLYALLTLGLDMPTRLLVLGAGMWWAMRMRRGRVVLVVGAIFLALAVLSSFFNNLAAVRAVYNATYPWGMHYRLLMIVAVCIALLSGAGMVALAEGWTSFTARLARPATRRRVRRLGTLLAVTAVLISVGALTTFSSVAARRFNTFVADDALAMGWLRDNVPPGTVVVNDGFADAGVWIPFKTNVAIVLRRLQTGDEQRELVIENVARLDQSPEARAAACDLHVGYVYFGAKQTVFARDFPDLEAMLASPALEEVFRVGNATIFRTRLSCAS
jgi:hypothetical protein